MLCDDRSLMVLARHSSVRPSWRLLCVVTPLCFGPFLVVLGVVAGSSWPAGAATAASTVTPADGRLRGPDFAATVTSVTWPSQGTVGGRNVDAPPGKRFVQFALNLDLDTDGISTGGSLPITATLTSAGHSQALDLSPIANEILGAGPGTGWQSGSGQFTEAVSNTSHQVDLELSEGSFSQTLNLWTLARVPPAPLVLYRDPNRPTVAGAGSSATSLGLSNPADGFTSSASVSVQSATLGYFAPSGVSSLTPNPNQAVLTVVLDGEFPSNPNDPTATGHYLGSQAPLPASMVTFTPAGERRASGHTERRRGQQRQGQERRRPFRRQLLLPRAGVGNGGIYQRGRRVLQRSGVHPLHGGDGHLDHRRDRPGLVVH